MWIKRDGQKDRPLPPFSPSPWPKRPWEGRRKEAGGWRAGLRRALQPSMPEELVFVSSCEEKGKTLFAVPEQLPVATREDFRNADRNSPNSSVEFLTRITLWLKIVLNGWNLVCDSSPPSPSVWLCRPGRGERDGEFSAQCNAPILRHLWRLPIVVLRAHWQAFPPRLPSAA